MGSSYSYNNSATEIPESVPSILTKYTPKEAMRRFESAELKKLQKTFKSMQQTSSTQEGIDEKSFAKHFLDNESSGEERFHIPGIFANHLFSAFDPNKQGFFTMDEFIVVMAVAAKSGVEDRLDLAFHVLSGYHPSIGRKGLSKVLTEMVSLSNKLLKKDTSDSTTSSISPQLIDDTVDNAFQKYAQSKQSMTYVQYREFVTEHAEIGDFLQVIIMKSYDSEWTPAYVPVIAEPPSPPKMDATSELLSDDDLLNLQMYLPTYEVGSDLHLLYSSALHGYSLISIINKCKSHAGSVLFVIKAISGERIGAYLSQSFKESSGSYYGDETSFLFKIKGSKLEAFTDHSNSNIVRTSNEGIALGGPEAALTIDSELDKCTTQASPSFNSPALLRTPNFRCVRVEVWSFQKKKEEDSTVKASADALKQQSIHNNQQESRKSADSASSGRKSSEMNIMVKSVPRGPSNTHAPVYKTRTSVEDMKKLEETKELEEKVKELRAEVAMARRSMSVENLHASLSRQNSTSSPKSKRSTTLAASPKKTRVSKK